jgi:hypothetical protein
MGRIIPFDSSFLHERRNAPVFTLLARLPDIARLRHPAIIGPRSAPPARAALRYRPLPAWHGRGWRNPEETLE